MALFSGDDGQERTEAPSPRRREDARKEGRIPRSAELSAAITVLGSGFLLAGVGSAAISHGTSEFLRRSAGALAGGELTTAGATTLVMQAGKVLLLGIAPLAIGLVALGLLSGLTQARGVVSGAPLQPKLEHLNPLKGLGRLLGAQAPFTLFKSIAKLTVLALVAWSALRHEWPRLTALTDNDVIAIAGVLKSLTIRLALSTGIAFLALAALDYGFQVWQHEKSLRMTRQEVIQEHKEHEGNPMVKSRFRSLANAMRRKRMLRDVVKADVVVTNPTHIAVALRYDPLTAPAPIVLAMGERLMAERIKAIARDAGIATIENRPLARALLATGTVGKMIPLELYTAVAELLAIVYRRRSAA